MNIQKEAVYIIGWARQHEARTVTPGPLVFFSTETGDAWMLDQSGQATSFLGYPTASILEAIQREKGHSLPE